jgi:hypothetical protein
MWNRLKLWWKNFVKNNIVDDDPYDKQKKTHLYGGFFFV